jgi:hypothetical protein
MGTRERRTQEAHSRHARIAALFVRPRTCYRAAQCVLAAGALFFRSLLGVAAAHQHGGDGHQDHGVATEDREPHPGRERIGVGNDGHYLLTGIAG